MILEIKGKIPDGEQFLITVNDEQKTITRKNKVACFDIPTEGLYHITVEQKIKESNMSLKYWIIYILTILFQGLFYIFTSAYLLMDFTDDSEKWYEHTNLYYVKSEFNAFIGSDKNINFRVVSGKYHKLTQMFIKPDIQIKSENNDISFEKSYVKDITDIKNEFCNYVRMIIAIVFTILSFSILFMIVMFNNPIIFGICTFTSILCLILGVTLPLVQYKKYKEITKL